MSLTPAGGILLADMRPLVRRVVGIQSFLRRPKMFRHALQVDPDPRPGLEAAAHRVDENVCRVEVRARVGMPRFPALESRESIAFARGSRNFNQRMLLPSVSGLWRAG